MNKSSEVNIVLKNQKDAKLLCQLLDSAKIEYQYYSLFALNNSRKTANTSRLPLTALIFGLAGFIFGFLLQYWAGFYNYQMNIGNKPFFAFVTSIPISFELAVLSAGIASFAAFIYKLKLDSMTESFHEDDFLFTFDEIHIEKVLELSKSINNKEVHID